MLFLSSRIPFLLGSGLLLSSLSAQAIEYPVGVPEQRNGMEIAAVYLQPVRMEPEGMMTPSEKSDVHPVSYTHLTLPTTVVV